MPLREGVARVAVESLRKVAAKMWSMSVLRLALSQSKHNTKANPQPPPEARVFHSSGVSRGSSAIM